MKPALWREAVRRAEICYDFAMKKSPSFVDFNLSIFINSKMITYPSIAWGIQLPSKRHTLVAFRETCLTYFSGTSCPVSQRLEAAQREPRAPSDPQVQGSSASRSSHASASLSPHQFLRVLPEAGLQLQLERGGVLWSAPCDKHFWMSPSPGWHFPARGFSQHAAVSRTSPPGTVLPLWLYCFTSRLFLSRPSPSFP